MSDNQINAGELHLDIAPALGEIAQLQARYEQLQRAIAQAKSQAQSAAAGDTQGVGDAQAQARAIQAQARAVRERAQVAREADALAGQPAPQRQAERNLRAAREEATKSQETHASHKKSNDENKDNIRRHNPQHQSMAMALQTRSISSLGAFATSGDFGSLGRSFADAMIREVLLGGTRRGAARAAAAGTPGIAAGAADGTAIDGVAGAAGAVGVAGILLGAPDSDVFWLVCGSTIAAALVATLHRVELWALHRRGYRRPALQEAARIRPLLLAAARAMGIVEAALPEILVDDGPFPEARATTRAVVLSRGLLAALDDHQLGGVLAHELGHHRAGDAAGAALVWAAALPLGLLHGALGWLAGGRRPSPLTWLAGMFYLPVDLALRLTIAPVAAWEGRRREYAADAAATAAGPSYRDGLRSALELLGALEVPRGGWEQALVRSHPPTALRIERLLPPEEAAAYAAAAG